MLMNIMKINKTKGFTLLEVMVALVISAIALLGLASLQAQSLTFNNSAFIRSQATYYAYDILDKMRMNKVMANNGSYDLALTDTPNTATCYGTGATCSESDLALADRFEWYTNVVDALPEGKTSVIRITGAGQTIMSVTVQWKNLNGAGTSEVSVKGEL